MYKRQANCGVVLDGLCGYLVTPSNAAENTYLYATVIPAATGNYWLGVYTNSGTTGWKFVGNAPVGESGTALTYTNWAAGEPNGANTGSPVVQFYGGSSGQWNDNSPSVVYNALYEWGGKGETPAFPFIRRTINVGVLISPAAATLPASSDLGSSSTDKITSDNTPSISVSSLSVGATVTITATPVSGTPITCTFIVTATTQTCDFGTLPDGTYSFTSTQSFGSYTSAASSALASVVIDTTGPTVVLTSTVATGGVTSLTTAFTITATFSEAVTGLLISEITKAGSSTGWVVGTALSGSGTTYTFTATNASGVPNISGSLILSIAQGVANDTAGNGNTLSANYVLSSVATVTFNANAGTGTAPTALAQSSSGGAVTLPATTAMTRAGFTAAGWNTAADGSGTSYAVGASYTPSAAITLYVKWNIVVTYLANGGSGSAPTAAIATISGGVNSVVVANANTLTRTRYTFAGWNLSLIHI